MSHNGILIHIFCSSWNFSIYGQIIQVMNLKLFGSIVLRVQKNLWCLYLFWTCADTPSYQNVHLFVYNLENISDAYSTLNNRGHYDVMFLVFSMKKSILFRSKTLGFLDKNTSLNSKSHLFYFASTHNEYESHYIALGDLIS